MESEGGKDDHLAFFEPHLAAEGMRWAAGGEDSQAAQGRVSGQRNQSRFRPGPGARRSPPRTQYTADQEARG